MSQPTFLAIFLTVLLASSSINGKKISLRELYNSKVIQAELVRRLKRDGSGYGHYGVVVTTYRGGRWLIHKGHNFSKHSDTVITSAAHMSKRWEVFEKKKVKGVTVGDYMKAAGRYYHPICDNALHGAKRMMLLGSKKSLKTMI